MKCTGEHGWFRTPILDGDYRTEAWRERRKRELVYVRVRWDRSDRHTTAFNEFMEEDRFAVLGDGQAVLVAVGALEEDELREAVQAESFSITRIAAKLGWSIGRTLDGLGFLRERELCEFECCPP